MSLKTCDCGHAPTPTEHTTGYGTDNNGSTRCFPCAGEYEREQFKLAGDERKPFAAYLRMASDGSLTVTTWAGAELAKVTSTRTVKLTRMSFTHGKAMLSYTAQDAHGREWYGRGNAGICTTLRRKGA